jgi:hypothetical protein
MAWAAAAQKAHEIATILCQTSFVPKSMQGQAGEVTGAILTGMELGVPIMWALNNIDLIDGSPAIRAKGLRALAFRAGHEMWTEESTSSRAIVCGRRKGTGRVEKSVWTIDRAKKAGIAGKKTWLAYPTDMLLNRATAEVVRLIAPDALIGVSHTVDELGGEETPAGLATTVEERQDEAPPKRRTAQRKPPPEPAPLNPPEPPADPAPAAADPAPEPAPPTEAEAVATMEAAGFEIVDVTDTGTGDDTVPEQAEPQHGPVPYPDPAEALDGEPADATPMTMPQQKRMAVEMRKAGFDDRDERIQFVCDVIGRTVTSSNQLTVWEASDVIQALIDLQTNTANGPEQAAKATAEKGTPDVDGIR